MQFRCRSYITGEAYLKNMASRQTDKMEKTQKLLDSDLQSVDRAEEFVLAAARKLGFDEDEAGQIGMAVRECTVNAVVHGNRYNKNKKVHLDIETSDTDLTVVIGDEGAGFDLNSIPDPLAPENLLNQSGRGLMIVKAFMDDFDLHPRPGGGAEVRLVKHRPQS